MILWSNDPVATTTSRPLRGLRVFINYRREDTAGYAGRLYDNLITWGGAGDVFMDVDGIPFGSEFDTVVQQELLECDVVLAIVGPHWLYARDEVTGQRRLDNAKDFVRLEQRLL